MHRGSLIDKALGVLVLAKQLLGIRSAPTGACQSHGFTMHRGITDRLRNIRRLGMLNNVIRSLL